MDSLLITDATEEFFFDDLPITTLQDFKTINLFIGANNTRKSRFARNIAINKHHLIVRSDVPFNDLLGKGNELVEKLKSLHSNNPNLSLVDYQATRRETNRDLRFGSLKEYFDHETVPMASYWTFSNHLDNIVNKINSIKSDNEIIELKNHIRRFYSFIDFVEFIYREAAEGKNISAINNHQEWIEENLNAIDVRVGDRDEGGNIRSIDDKVQLFADIKEFTEVLFLLDLFLWTGRSVYIPILRFSRNLTDEQHSNISKTILESTISDQYFGDIKPPAHIDIHTGQNLYDRIDAAKRGKTVKRKNFAEFESFIGKSFYQSEAIEITAYKESHDEEIIVTLPGERPDVAIHNLGDGVQAIINLFFPIFTADNGAWIFIDEPELNLHPGFQNLFVRTLLENDYLKQKKLRYFITTHSNHILSEAILGGDENTEVYVFHRRNANTSNIKPFKGIRNATLDLLGVLNTSTLVSNCSIWVEGVTDRLYIRAFLTAYLKTINGFQPLEGLNYAFIEYGGKNLVHYDFDMEDIAQDMTKIDVFFINRNVFLIADTDTKKEKQHTYYKSLENKTFIYRETIVPEIENLLPFDVLGMYLKLKLGLTDTQFSIISAHSYETVKLGAFLSKHLTAAGIERKIQSKTGGTLSASYKSGLAEFVFQEVQRGNINWEHLCKSKILSELVIDLYKFILENNRPNHLSPDIT